MKSLLPFLLVSLLPCLASPAAAPASDPNALANFPRLRGMTVPYRADAKVFHDAAANGANAVRLILSPLTTSASHPAAAWQKMVENLPYQLDAAREAHLTVIVSLFTPPVDLNFGPTAKDEDRKAALHTFWTDPKSLDTMIAQAVQTARLLKPYEGMVWLELKNEPLDWADYPAIPRNWPEWAQKLVDAVRAVSPVPIVVQVGPGGLCSGFATFPKLKGDNLVFSLHNYQPHEYTHQGVKQLIGTDLAHPYDQVGKKWPGDFGDGKGASGTRSVSGKSSSRRSASPRKTRRASSWGNLVSPVGRQTQRATFGITLNCLKSWAGTGLTTRSAKALFGPLSTTRLTRMGKMRDCPRQKTPAPKSSARRF